MVFSSISFLFYFLPAFFALYYLSRQNNLVLLLASILFYSWGEPVYVLLLLFSIAINYGFGLWIAACRVSGHSALGAGILANLLLLGYFKYFTFLSESLDPLLSWLGLPPMSPEPVPLPLGISFFTFQAISYLVDVHRNRSGVFRNPLDLAVYISMFPQLVAGPIVRFESIAGEIRQRRIDTERITLGIQVFVIGLAQKVLIANTVAGPADQIFSLPPESLTLSLAWTGITCYTLQIYFDFAGYSSMAIGMGYMMGFTFPQNFNYPYVSQSITEFWRRWHISLSSWFRDYLYIPLGGNRGSSLRTYRNLFIVFILCGLWHGASWTFVFWGFYHGMFLVFERAGFGKLLAGIWRPMRHLYALLVTMIGWVFFRSDSIGFAWRYLHAMFGGGAGDPVMTPVAQYVSHTTVTAILIGTVASTPLVPALSGWLENRGLFRRAASGRATAVALGLSGLGFGSVIALLLLSAASLASGTYNPFIYFRF